MAKQLGGMICNKVDDCGLSGCEAHEAHKWSERCQVRCIIHPHVGAQCVTLPRPQAVRQLGNQMVVDAGLPDTDD